MSIAPEHLANIRLLVLQRAIAALVMTHPDPKAFADIFRTATSLSQVDHLLAPNAPDAWKREAADFAREIAELADAEVASRRQRKDRGG